MKRETGKHKKSECRLKGRAWTEGRDRHRAWQGDGELGWGDEMGIRMGGSNGDGGSEMMDGALALALALGLCFSARVAVPRP